MRVGFIGLGNMGGPIALNIVKAGHSVVVHDLRREAATDHLELGARWADSPKAVAQASEVVFTCLPGPKEIEAVALGEDGILEGIQPDAVYVDASTSTPTLIRRIAEVFKGKGAHVLDAPVSGGTVGAREGTLGVMVGGDPAIFERVKPIIQSFGAGIHHVGDVGAGEVCKLVHNMVAITTRLVIAEGMTLAVKAGVTPAAILEVLKSASFGKQRVLHSYIPQTVFTGKFEEAHFSLRLSAKDIGLARQMAQEFNVPVMLAALAEQQHSEAFGRGWADWDSHCLFLLQEERAGVQVRDSNYKPKS